MRSSTGEGGSGRLLCLVIRATCVGVAVLAWALRTGESEPAARAMPVRAGMTMAARTEGGEARAVPEAARVPAETLGTASPDELRAAVVVAGGLKHRLPGRLEADLRGDESRCLQALRVVAALGDLAAPLAPSLLRLLESKPSVECFEAIAAVPIAADLFVPTLRRYVRRRRGSYGSIGDVVRWNSALRSLARLGASTIEPETLLSGLSMLAHGDQVLILDSIRNAGRSAQDAAAAYVIDNWSPGADRPTKFDDNDAEVAGHDLVPWTLGKLGSPLGGPTLRWLAEGGPSRAAALRALGEIRPVALANIQMLVDALTSADTRTPALDGLITVGPDANTARARRALRKLIDDENATESERSRARGAWFALTRTGAAAERR